MRRAGRVDNTHAEIRNALREAGVRVLGLGAYGNGVPDFACSYRGFTALVEAKSPNGKLTARQNQLLKDWEGTVIVAFSGPEAVEKFFQAYGCSHFKAADVRRVQVRFCQDAPIGKSCRVPAGDE